MDIRRLLQQAAACALLLLLLLALTATGVDAESTPCRVQDCPNLRAIRYYEELGCERSDGSNECCPTRYNCSRVTSLDKTKCHYRGKAYDPGTTIHEEMEAVCTPSCTCLANSDGSYRGEATFHCAHVDCPEHFANQPVDEPCWRQYSLDQCCSTGVQCGNATEGRKEVQECFYNGRRFLEGQQILVPENECLACVCQEGFNGTLDGPWCRTYTCDYTLVQSLSAVTTCAPIFWKTRKCCPMGWHCPSPDDRLIGRSEPPAEGDDHCTFGNHRLNIGDELRADQSLCIKCRCDIPPFITCAQLDESECESEI